MKLSIVTTLYRSAPYLPEFYRRISAAVQSLTGDYEIIFVNDGSPDESLGVALDLFERDDHVRVVDLSRNFGHHKAMMTGLSYAQGDFIFLIDCDLEEPPELLTTFYQTLTNSDADVVYGVQAERKRGVFDALTSRTFYKVFNFLSDHPIPENLLTIRLMTRRYNHWLVQHRERQFVISGLWQLTGFKQIPLVVDKAFKGESTYTFIRKALYLIYAIAVFSNKPLIYITYLGLLMVLPSGLYIIVLVLQYLVGGVGVDGWASVIVSLWFLGGLIISILGVIAIYLSVIFVESKDRPYTVIRDVYQRDTHLPAGESSPAHASSLYHS